MLSEENGKQSDIYNRTIAMKIMHDKTSIKKFALMNTIQYNVLGMVNTIQYVKPQKWDWQKRKKLTRVLNIDNCKKKNREGVLQS